MNQIIGVTISIILFGFFIMAALSFNDNVTTATYQSTLVKNTQQSIVDIAEVINFGYEKVTTGASNDIERATDIARSMVTKWGLSDKLGPLAYGEDEGEVFLGRSVSKTKGMSDHIAQQIDEEIRAIIDKNYQRAKDILESHIKELHLMAGALMKYETIDSKQIKEIMEGREPSPPEGWNDQEPTQGVTASTDSETKNKKEKNKNIVGDPASDTNS